MENYLIPHPRQEAIIQSKARFKIIRAGRRSGKSTLAVEQMVFMAVSGKNRNVFYLAPTQIQARSIIWEALKSRVAGIGSPNESRLEMKLPTADGGFSLIKISGWENRENFRGMKAYHIFFDELDTMQEFFIGWQEIFRPALTDTGGGATFIGTPKKENPNLRRLEKVAETDSDYKAFHFPTSENPHIPPDEIRKAKEELALDTFRQEYLAEYVDNAGALFSYNALLDVFTNTVEKDGNKYLIIDVADDGSDSTVFSFWEGLEEYRREKFHGLRGDARLAQIREYQQQEQIPMSHTLVDGIGVGADIAANSLMIGMKVFKGSFSAVATDINISRLPHMHYTSDAPRTSEFKNLRVQCIFTLADYVNKHKIASRVTGRFKESILEELPLYQETSKGDGKRFCTPKEDIKALLGRSPDDSDTWQMRMYFEIMKTVLPGTSQEDAVIAQRQRELFAQRKNWFSTNSTR